MSSVPNAVVLAGCFVTGCLMIDILHERAEEVTLVLLLVLIVLANLTGGLLLSSLAPAVDAVPALEPALGPASGPALEPVSAPVILGL